MPVTGISSLGMPRELAQHSSSVEGQLGNKILKAGNWGFLITIKNFNYQQASEQRTDLLDDETDSECSDIEHSTYKGKYHCRGDIITLSETKKMYRNKHYGNKLYILTVVSKEKTYIYLLRITQKTKLATGKQSTETFSTR